MNIFGLTFILCIVKFTLELQNEDSLSRECDTTQHSSTDIQLVYSYLLVRYATYTAI